MVMPSTSTTVPVNWPLSIESPPVPLSSMVGLATPGAASTVTGFAAEVPAVSRMKASTLPGS